MSHPKLTIKQWQHFSTQMSFSKQTVEELSKLYIIVHQKVKSSIKDSVINPQKAFSIQAHHHIELIKSILDKINDTQNDQYLAQVQSDLLSKYKKNFLSLLSQIQIMLKVEESQSNLNFTSLKSIKPQKRQKNDLKSEVVQSTRRITRAKSGYKGRKQESQTDDCINFKHTKQQTSKIDQFFATNITLSARKTERKLTIQNQNDLETAFKHKQQAIDRKMQNSIIKTSNGLGVSFQKKYQGNYLEMYFNERKQFADLIFNQDVYNKIIEKNEGQSKELERSESHIPSKILKMEEVNVKLFPQFQIKTKFMKPAVKSKISNLITQIKKELLQVYQSQNIGALKAVNESQKEKFTERKGISIPTLRNRSYSYSSINPKSSLQTIQQSRGNKVVLNQANKFSQTQYGINFNKSPKKPNKIETVHLLNKKQIFGPKTRKSFINPNPKSFYESQKWNQEVQKKYQNRIMAKILHAKF